MRNYKPVKDMDRVRFTPEQLGIIDHKQLDSHREQVAYLTKRAGYLKRKLEKAMSDTEEKLTSGGYKNNSLLLMYNKAAIEDIKARYRGEDEDANV